MEEHASPEFSERARPVVSFVALKCAQLHRPVPRPERDALITATALVHGMKVVTGKLSDFEATGAKIIDF